MTRGAVLCEVVCMFIWPGQMRRKARRRVAAISAWETGAFAVYKRRHKHHEDLWQTAQNLNITLARALGYLAAHDWIGVDSAYNAARRIIDQDE